MDEKANKISFNYGRTFGAEMELNASDLRDFKVHKLQNGENPKGMEYICSLLQEKLNFEVAMKAWHLTHDNSVWILKPDSSCGMELCPPPMKGWAGIKKICQAADLFKNDQTNQIKADERCSFHVHIDVSDLDKDVLGKVLLYWVKCESVFLDSVPSRRKRNRYCQCIGMTDLFEHDTLFNADNLLKKLKTKYFTLNTFHYCAKLEGSPKGGRFTIEFRIAENEACLNSFLIKNWIRLIIHFVERAIKAELPEPYVEGNPWTGMCWLDLKDVFKMLGFDGEYELSPGMEQTRNWFAARIHHNIMQSNKLTGIWSSVGRKVHQEQINEIIKKHNIDVNQYLEGTTDLIYNDKYNA